MLEEAGLHAGHGIEVAEVEVAFGGEFGGAVDGGVEGGQLARSPQGLQELRPLQHIGGIVEGAQGGIAIARLANHGEGEVVVDALLVFQEATQTLDKKVCELRAHAAVGPAVDRLWFNQRFQIQRPTRIPNDVHHGVGGAAQGEGIGGAGGQQANAEEATEGVEPIGQGHDSAGLGGGQCVACALGEVVLTDRNGHGFRFATGAGIFFAHDPLQFGELEHHLGDEIRLAQEGGPVHQVPIVRGQLQLVGQAIGHGDDPIDLGPHTAQLVLERDGF